MVYGSNGQSPPQITDTNANIQVVLATAGNSQTATQTTNDDVTE